MLLCLTGERPLVEQQRSVRPPPMVPLQSFSEARQENGAKLRRRQAQCRHRQGMYKVGGVGLLSQEER